MADIPLPSNPEHCYVWTEAEKVVIHAHAAAVSAADCAALREELGSLISKFHDAMSDAGWHPGRTDDNLCDIIRAKGKELTTAQAELEQRRKSGGASDRLHNLCEGIADHADGSEFSREEWQRIDAENTALTAERDQAQKLLSDATMALGRVEVERDALREQIDQTTAIANEATSALASRDRAMDALRSDALRWRHVRDKCAWTATSANGMTRIAIRLPVDTPIEADDELDGAVDAALKGVDL